MKLKVALILVLVVAGAGAVFVSMGGLTARAATTTYLTATAATADVSDDVAATGAVVGINTAIAGNAEGLGFAIPIKAAADLIAIAHGTSS